MITLNTLEKTVQEIQNELRSLEIADKYATEEYNKGMIERQDLREKLLKELERIQND